MSNQEIIPYQPKYLHKNNQQLAIRRGREYQADEVPHLGIAEVNRIIDQAKERDKLLIRLLFDGCLRASESILVRPQDIEQSQPGWIVRILGKGSKHGTVAISSSLAAQLKAYAYDKAIKPDERLFKINRFRVHQIVKAAMSKAGVVKPDGVGSVHVLRHSGAIARLQATGNPKAVQDQLRHKSALMTLRYMKTLSHQESLKIQQGVDFQW